MIPSTQRTTPAQWTVVAWLAIVVLLTIALIAGYWSLRAAAPEDVASLRWIAVSSFALAAIAWAIKWSVARFVG